MKCNVFLGWSLDRPDRSPGKDCWLVPDKSDENLIFFWESLYHDILHGLWLELAMNLFTKRLRNTDDASLDCVQKNCEVS